MPDLSPNFCKKHYNDVSWSKGACPYCRIDHLESLLRRAGGVVEYCQSLVLTPGSELDTKTTALLREITDAVGGDK